MSTWELWQIAWSRSTMGGDMSHYKISPDVLINSGLCIRFTGGTLYHIRHVIALSLPVLFAPLSGTSTVLRSRRPSIRLLPPASSRSLACSYGLDPKVYSTSQYHDGPPP